MTSTAATRLPGPRLACTVLAKSLMHGPLYVNRLHERHGDLLSTWAPGYGGLVILRHPELIAQVQAAPGVDFTEGFRALNVLFGPQSVFCLSGAAHRQARRLLMSPVSGVKLGHCRSVMDQTARQMVDSLPRDTPFPLLPHLRHTVLETSRRLVVGDQEDHAADAWRAAFQTLHKVGITTAGMLDAVGVLPIWPPLRRARQVCDRLIDDEIARRHRTGKMGDDALTSLLTADAADLNHETVRDHIVTLMLVGMNTILGAAWAVERALRHPAIWQRVVVEAIDGTEDTYTDAVAREALRARPPSVIQLWLLRRPLELAGHMLPSGTPIAPNIMSLHHHPDFYPDPSAFQPERFLETRPPRNAWMPFGGGPHACPGGHLALTHIKTLLHTIARSATVLAADPRDERTRLHALVFNVPARGCRIVVQGPGRGRCR